MHSRINSEFDQSVMVSVCSFNIASGMEPIKLIATAGKKSGKTPENLDSKKWSDVVAPPRTDRIMTDKDRDCEDPWSDVPPLEAPPRTDRIMTDEERDYKDPY